MDQQLTEQDIERIVDRIVSKRVSKWADPKFISRTPPDANQVWQWSDDENAFVPATLSGTSSGHTIKENGTAVTSRANVDFIDSAAGAGLITDDGTDTEVNLSLYVLEAQHASDSYDAGHHAAVTAADAGHTVPGQAITSTAASETVSGHVELATTAETTTGTDTGRVPPVSALPLQIQNGKWVYAAGTSGTDDYAIAPSPAITAYADGQVFYFKADTGNTGAATLAVNGLAALPIYKHKDQALETGDIEATQIIAVAYESAGGGNFQMLSQMGNSYRVGLGEDGGASIGNLTRINASTGLDASYLLGIGTIAVDVTELSASAAEITTGTETTKVVTPDGFAGSDFGIRLIYVKVMAEDTALTTGDGKALVTIPAELNGMNLVDAHAAVYTVSSSGTPTVQIHNLTDTVDMLSTLITIDANEFSSYTAVAAPAVNGAADDVVTGDRLRIDVDVAGTGTAGLDVILSFQLP